MLYLSPNLRVEFSSGCLDTLSKLRQISTRSAECGGQLFARVGRGSFFVQVATTTEGQSKSGRFWFRPDRMAERADILEMFKKGLHYVGDWHTHPEKLPTPSSADVTRMQSIFMESIHDLPMMLLVVVGQAVFPDGLFVGAVSHGPLEQMGLGAQ